MYSRPHEPPLPPPLAYFLTWPTYGTWLPGDDRGWVDYRHGWKPPDPIRRLEAEAMMKEDACVLDPEQRKLVEETIRDHCRVRVWRLHEVNCRSNHIHVVATANVPPKQVQVQFKAWATRRLKEREAMQRGVAPVHPSIRTQWWAERGSRRWINDEESLEATIKYVREGQDEARFE